MLQRTHPEITSVSAYRADIDGLRAIAVLSVVAYHYGANWLPGGFTGVDMFFVISGFLITQSLVHDIAAGGNWLGRFYNRRARRLLPALLTVLVASVVAGYFILMPGDYASMGTSASYSAFGLGNLYFYWNTGYFDREAELQPLLHLWSLGVEEQFYVAWPLLLACLLKLPRGAKTATIVALGMLVVSSIYFAQNQLTIDPKAAFYLPFPRAWELAIGATLAFLPSIRSRHLSTSLLAAGLLAIGFSLFFISSDTPFPGVAAVPAVIGAALIVARKEDVGLCRVLTNLPMVTIGLISYSLYLWHWPILVFYRHYISGAMPDAFEATGLALVSFTLAAVTWAFIEPIRKVRFSMSKTLFAALCASLAIATVGAVLQRTDGMVGRFPEFARSISGLDEMWKWDGCRRGEKVEGIEDADCVFGAKWAQSTSRGLVWGDSHAEHFSPLIEAVLPPGASAALVVPCPAILGEHVTRIRLEQPDFVGRCKSLQERVVDYINSGSVDWVVIASAWGSLSTKISQDGSLSSDLNGIGLTREGTRQLLSRINRNVTITILGQTPSNMVDPPPCALQLRRSNCDHQSELAAVRRKLMVAPMDDMFAQLAKDYHFQFLSPSSKLCSPDRCDPLFEGQPLYRDTSHLRRNLPVNVREDLARRLELERIFLPAG